MRASALIIFAVIHFALSLSCQIATPNVTFGKSATKFFDWEKQMRESFRAPDGGMFSGHKQFERAAKYYGLHTNLSGSNFNHISKNMEQLEVAQNMMPDESSDWMNLGPLDSEIGMGRVSCIEFVDADTWLVGTAGGGLWKTDCAGIYLPGFCDEPWQCLTDNLPVLAVAGVTFNPDNPNEIYILTGDGDWTIGSTLQTQGVCPVVPSMGIFKSNDGGSTWTVTSLVFPSIDIVGAYKLMMHPDDPLKMFACTTNGMYFTDDAWATNVLLWDDCSVRDMEFHPSDNNIIYFAMLDGDSVPLVRRTGASANNAVTIDVANEQMANIKIAVSPAAPDALHICTAHNNDFAGYYFSEDQGNTIDVVFDEDCSNSGNIIYSDYSACGKGQGGYTFCIGAHPLIPNFLYIGGVALSTSVDGGNSWGLIADEVHADFHEIVWNPFTNLMVVATDGGIWAYSSDDEEWYPRNHGLMISQFYHIDVNNIYPGMVVNAMVGAQDNGTTVGIVATPTLYHEVSGGDGFNCHFGSYDADAIYYSEVQYGKLYVSNPTDDGSAFAIEVTPANEIIEGNDNRNGAWDTPYEMHHLNTGNVLAGYNKLYFSNTAGNAWLTAWTPQVVSPDYGDNNSRIKDIAWGDNWNDAAFVYHNTSSDEHVIFRTELLSLSVLEVELEDLNWQGWTLAEITNNVNLSNVPVSDIVYYPAVNSEAMIITIPGYIDTVKVYMFDGDSTWTNISFDLPNVPILTAKTDEYGIYVGTDIGIFYKYVNESIWTYIGEGMPAVPVTDIEIEEDFNGRNLYVGTYGRGIWRGTAAPANRITRWYVNDDASGANNGTSWEDAFVSIILADVAAQDGDSVWVAAGTYFATDDNLPQAARNESFEFQTGNLHIYGGFAGWESSIEERIYGMNQTVLSGDNGIDGDNSDNSYHVLANNTRARGIYDRLTIAYGNADGDELFLLDNGAGVFVNKGEFGMGGGLVVFRECSFLNNVATGNGGGVYIKDALKNEEPVRFENCVFEMNQANIGGGFYIGLGDQDEALWGDASIKLDYCSFQDNYALSNGGALATNTASGGKAHFSMVNCSFTNNIAEANGGAIYNYAGKNNSNYDEPGDVNIQYSGCNFDGNTALRGGAVCDLAGSGDFDYGAIGGAFLDCSFQNCSAEYYGGGVYVDATNLNCLGNYSFDNCTFSDMDSNLEGGAMKIDGSNSGQVDLNLNNCSFTGCDAGSEGGAICGDAFVLGELVLVCDSCTFANCTSDMGGAIWLRSTSTTTAEGTISGAFTHSVFNENHANGPVNMSRGGAVHHDGAGSHFCSYQHCTFTGNHSNQRAGAVSIEQNNITFDQCDFIENYCDAEGGVAYIYHWSSDAEHITAFDSCFFQNNSSGGNGGAICGALNSGLALNVPISHCSFIGNLGQNGACVYISGAGISNLNLQSTLFEDNHTPTSGDGGVILYNTAGDVQIADCTFSSNSSDMNGGALELLSYGDDVNININNSVFSGNNANLAGAIHIKNTNTTNMDVSISGCTIANNTASQGVGGIMFEAYDFCNIELSNTVFSGNQSLLSTYSTGALYLKSYSSTDTTYMHVDSCSFESNSAAGAAGALHFVSDGAMRSLVEHSDFTNNISNSHGGAIRVYTFANGYADVELRNCLMDGNYSAARGGAIHFETSTSNAEVIARVNQCVIVNNEAANGGAIHSYVSTTGAYNDLELFNCTVANNHATVKCGGIYMQRTNGTLSGNLVNSIFWGNTDVDIETTQKQAYVSGVGIVNVGFCDIQNGLPDGMLQTGDILIDHPEFNDATNTNGIDGLLRTVDDGFALQGISECIDVANEVYATNVDFAVTPRPQLDGYDIGAYEAMSATQAPCFGDINFDGVVDTSDFLLLIEDFGCISDCSNTDLDNNDVVGAADIQLFVGAYGTVCD